MNLATKALEFWDYQKQTELEYHRMSLKNQQMRLQSVEKQCNEKLMEAQNKINVLTHQLNSVREELETSKKEAAELQEKYAERTRYCVLAALGHCSSQGRCSLLSADRRESWPSFTNASSSAMKVGDPWAQVRRSFFRRIS